MQCCRLHAAMHKSIAFTKNVKNRIDAVEFVNIHEQQNL